MCEIKVYLNEKSEKNKLGENVSSYDLDVNNKTLTTYKLFADSKEFRFESIEKVTWSEAGDFLIVTGKLEGMLEGRD